MPSLPEILAEHRVPFALGGSHHHVRKNWVGVDCVRCGANSGKFHAAIHLTTYAAHCWRCGRLDVAQLLVDLTGQPFRIVKGWLAGRDRLPRAQRERSTGRLELPIGLGPLLPCHRRYLQRRGFDADELERLWGIQGIGLSSHLAWRIFIPCHLDGRIVSWTTRSIGSEPRQRYLSAPPEKESISAKELLWGEDYCCQSIVVVEGPFDAMRIGPGAAAVVGLSITDQQVLRISRYPIRAICFDAEPSAQRRADALARQLSPYPGDTSVVRIETGKDAAEAEIEEIMEIRARFLGR